MSYCTRIFLLALVLLFGTCRLQSQDQPEQPFPQEPQQPPPDQPQDQNGQDNPFAGPPKPAGQALPYFDFGVFGGGSDLQPDYTPLSGMLNAGLGFPAVKHSYWVPGVSFTSTVQSNLFGTSSSTGWFNSNYVTGDLSLLEAWSRSQLALNYSGGGSFSSNSAYGNSGFQELAFAESFLLNRWIVQIVDEFAQLPESGFGFGIGTTLGVGGVGGSLGTTIPGVGNNYNQNQSILSGFGPRYSNVGVMQATYQLTKRSSITASGSYGILHFIDSGNIDTRSLFGGLGYDYKITHKDTIGLFYQFSSFQFPGDPQAIGTQTASAAYSRKITGRLALSLYGGPQFTTFRIPIGTTSSMLNGYASANLNYALHNGGISGNYIHGVSGGSGLLAGSLLDEARITASRRLSRVWHANLNVGYAHNRTPANQGGTVGNPSYDDWFAGVGVGRPFGRNLTFTLAYSARFETHNPGCNGTSCGSSATTSGQYISVSFRWHPRPFALE